MERTAAQLLEDSIQKRDKRFTDTTYITPSINPETLRLYVVWSIAFARDYKEFNTNPQTMIIINFLRALRCSELVCSPGKWEFRGDDHFYQMEHINYCQTWNPNRPTKVTEYEFVIEMCGSYLMCQTDEHPKGFALRYVRNNFSVVSGQAS